MSDLERRSRSFPHEKGIVLSALYDTIEALGLRLESASGVDGMLIVSAEDQGKRRRIHLGATVNEAQTKVFILPESTTGGFSSRWSAVILDELSATIRKNRYSERRGR